MKTILRATALLLCLSLASPLTLPLLAQREIKANDATATHRRVYFHLVDATDGITPETGEAGGQPQVSTDGAAWTNTGIGTLTHIGNGRYYADVTQTLIATAGVWIETRYKSANTAESLGSSIDVRANDPYVGDATVQRAVAFTNFPIWMLSTAGAGVPSISTALLTCLIQKDGGAWATTNDTTETEVGGAGSGRGKYVIDLTAAELTASVVSLECTGAGASIYRVNITTQR